MEPTSHQEPPRATPPQPAPAGSALERELYQHRPPDRLTTLDEHGRRMWVYPAAIRGVFMRWRKVLGYFVIAVYFVMPWIKIRGMQSILIEIPERRFILFGQVFWPQDVFYLVFLLLGMALALFFFTAVAGRVWCGWLCPQTVFMEEIFRKIEEWTEGDHHAQQDLGQPQLGQQRARQHFAQQADPVRAAGEDLVRVPGGGSQQTVVHAEQFSFEKDLHACKRRKSSLYHARGPGFSCLARKWGRALTSPATEAPSPADSGPRRRTAPSARDR